MSRFFFFLCVCSVSLVFKIAVAFRARHKGDDDVQKKLDENKF